MPSLNLLFRAPHRPAADRWRRTRGLPGGRSREAIADRLACGAGKEPNLSPSSPAPRPGPSTPQRWPAVPTSSTGPCAALHGWGQLPRTAGLPRRLAQRGAAARWLTLLSLGWVLAKWRCMRPRSLLDNARWQAAGRWCRWCACPRLIRQATCRALAVTASSYSSGDHVTFFEGGRAVDPGCASRAAPCATASRTNICWPGRHSRHFPATAIEG